MGNKERITELEEEIGRLKAGLEKAKEQLQDTAASRTAMLFMMEDLNETYAKVSQGKKEWESTFDAIQDPIFIHDTEFRIVRANRAYQMMTGMEFKEFIGKPYYEAFPKMDGPFKACEKALELQGEAEEEISLPSIDKVFKVRSYHLKAADDGYLSAIHVMEDITEKKRAEERIKQEMEITANLLDIADSTAHTTNIDKLMQEVLHCSHKVMGCDVCLSYLYDRESKVLRPSHAAGLAHDMIPIFRTELLDGKTGFVKEVFEKREPMVMQFKVQRIEKTEDEKLRSSEIEKNLNLSTAQPLNLSTSAFSYLPDINTIAVIPLIGKEDYLGLIIGIYTRPMEPDERDRRVMKGIFHQVSSALEEARLYKENMDKTMELSHKIETIQVMHEIDRSILSTLNPQEVLESAARMISQIIPCDGTNISLVDKERAGFVFTAGFGVTCHKGAFAPFSDTSATEVVKTKRPQFVANMMEIQDLPPVERDLLKEGCMSHIRLPLIVRDEVAGILSIGAKRRSAFTPADLSTLDKIASQIGVALENTRLVTDLQELFLSILKTLSQTIDAKSQWTRGHSDRVTKYAIAIAREMGMDERGLKDIEIAGLLHDIGKIGTYEAILDKAGKLTDEELKVMRQHPGKGADILAPIKQLKDITPAVKYHHEFYDGTGYPDGLKGDEIPLMARILTVADTVDAMGADRPYRKGRPTDAIIAELKRCSGTQFDPDVVEVFLKVQAMGKLEEAGRLPS